MGTNLKAASKYQIQHLMLGIMGKILLNATISGLLLGFGFWLSLASNMGPAYLPTIMGGALDRWIRFIMLGIGAIIWLATPIWFLWSSVRDGYSSYQEYKRSHSKDKLM